MSKLNQPEMKSATLRAVAIIVACGFSLGLISGCQRSSAHYNPALAGTFFPLAPDSTWTYRIQSKSQKSTYVITDKVLGVKYVPSLNVTGQVVEEFYNLDRGGSRPIVYVSKDGYLSRLSGLEYAKDDIQTPAWGRSEEGEFMPARMVPDVSWNSTIFPFGHIGGAFVIKQAHHTAFEPSDVTVPAGKFTGCMRIDTIANYEGGSFAKSKKASKLLYRDWYAPNVGLVKTEVLEGGEHGSRMELVELMRFVNPAVTPPPVTNN
ncbi:MAG: hypothetical protein ACREQT_02070 [Candidatus Binataceae bacterium]